MATNINFLNLFHPRKRRWKNRRTVAITSVLIGLLFVFLVFAIQSGLRIAQKTQQAKDHLAFSIELLRDQQWDAALDNIEQGQHFLRDAQDDLQPWLVFRIIPFVGRQVRALYYLLGTVDRLSNALERATLFGQETVTTILGDKPFRIQDITPEQKRTFLGKLFEAPPILQGILADVDLAGVSLKKVPTTLLLPSLGDVAYPLQEQLPRLRRSLTIALPFMEALPLVSGYPEEQTYLFLFQNNDEIRPTGGFIGTYGLLNIRDGEIQSLHTDNIYRLDRLAERQGLRVTPPPPLQAYLGLGKDRWFLRDSNWSPDFPTAARQALWFHEKETGEQRKIDGVIAVTPTVVVRLLELFGPVTIDQVTFTPKNIVDTLQYHVEQGYVGEGLPEIERKEIIGRLAKLLLEKTVDLPLSRIPDLLDVFESSVREKHILLYEIDPNLQRIATGEGWDGRVLSTEGDFAMVIDANLAALKTDSVMERSLEYTVEPSGNRLKARLTVHYANTGRFSWKTTRYRTYTRVYVPKGSTLLRADGFMESAKPWPAKKAEIGEDLGKTVFSGFINVEPRASHTLTLEYLLPQSVVKNPYTLYFQKQSGTLGYPLTVDLKFGTRIKQWSPTGFTVNVRGKEVRFETDLRVDRQFEILF